MNRKVQATIEKYSMLQQGDTVVAAVSGGADSAALLHLLCAFDPKYTVRACHLNHCLRGEESERDEELVRTMCREYGVPLDVRRASVAKAARRRKQSIELIARQIRYQFFEELSQHYHAHVATAHTLSDSAETVLFHLARGTGLEGLCGIPPVRGPYIRPLLECSRQEIEQYCALHDIGYVNDSTNGQDDYARNYIRHHVLPPLLHVNGGALRAMERVTQMAREDADYLGARAGEYREQFHREDGVDADALRKVHPAIRSRIILKMLEEQGIESSAFRVSQAEDVLFGREGSLCAGKQIRVTVRDGVFLFHRVCLETPEPLLTQIFSKNSLNNQQLCLPGGRQLNFSVITVKDYEIFKNNGHNDLICALDYDKMENDIVIRSRMQGDRIRPAGRGCSKSLKKLYNELAVTRRDSRCVLADSQGVLFAEGAGVDERAAPNVRTCKILMVKMMEEMEYDAGY